ncbi:MAG TPA: FMN-binding protein [Mobilitalea sp.]|nr:FMN-binding protein [Mobilitalea sp.]
MNRKKLIILLIGMLLVIGATILAVYLHSVSDYKTKVANINITDIDLSKIPDGTYIGECNVDFIYAKVSVTVKNAVITDIKLLEHKNGKGKPAEAIIKSIIDKQSLEVDAVSGATNSSKVIKKAIENALTGIK